MIVFWDVVPCSLAPLKRRSISTRLQDATSQKSAIFILVAGNEISSIVAMEIEKNASKCGKPKGLMRITRA
jgi:hypothetical protein